jgi:hypothetical protein
MIHSQPPPTKQDLGILAFDDRVTGRVDLCRRCVSLIRRAGPGTLYRYTDLSAPLETAPAGFCEHCGRSDD